MIRDFDFPGRTACDDTLESFQGIPFLALLALIEFSISD